MRTHSRIKIIWALFTEGVFKWNSSMVTTRTLRNPFLRRWMFKRSVKNKGILGHSLTPCKFLDQQAGLGSVSTPKVRHSYQKWSSNLVALWNMEVCCLLAFLSVLLPVLKHLWMWIRSRSNRLFHTLVQISILESKRQRQLLSSSLDGRLLTLKP